MNRQVPRGPADLDCPFWQEPMAEVCHKCPLWIRIVGKNPQSEEHIERWSCAFAELPILAVENSQQQRGTQAAVESFRNEMVKANHISNVLRVAELKQNGGARNWLGWRRD
jgi:hypothetical protein